MPNALTCGALISASGTVVPMLANMEPLWGQGLGLLMSARLSPCLRAC